MEGIDYISLIHKSLTGQINPQENVLLQQWIEADPKNRNEYFEIKLIWETDIEDEPFMDEAKFERSRQRLEDSLTQAINHERTTTRITRSALLMFFVGVATLSTAVYMAHQSPTPPPQKFSIAVSNIHNHVTLSDSSTVTLHDNSSITSNYNDHLRTLELKGEAFIDVKKEKRPFVIHAGESSITVKGTSFYLKAYPKTPLEILVLSGNVEVQFRNKQWMLQKDMYLSLANGLNSVTLHQPKLNFTTWHTGKLEFKKTPLQEVIHQIEIEYKIHCVVPSEIQNCVFTGKFENTPLSEVIQTLSYSMSIDFKETSKDNYLLSGKGCSP